MTELGRKLTCSECGVKFYDLGRADATCPKCGQQPEPVDDSALLKRPSRRGSAPAKAKPKAKAKAKAKAKSRKKGEEAAAETSDDEEE